MLLLVEHIFRRRLYVVVMMNALLNVAGPDVCICWHCGEHCQCKIVTRLQSSSSEG